ncbi:hypothetical protein GCM10008018_65830 [Paenibacillus marchantiophytorum]|uniref:Lipoprotein n=1 Tax=Paenibacillus marchantiophytorum TaxID=1619310 RepID=A0ABQ1FHC0_9BACL|nr:hypothetical protein [Paenibacillus marchantiophytorum]GGA11595.1 hypothetical protein GCM10008018_65830 [Paenibacillus marchantiophytorum]
MKIIIYMFIFVSLFTACDQSRGSYPAQVMWGDVIYSESAETVPSKDIGEQIGETNKRVHPLPKNNGEANSAEVGSKLYRIVGEDQQKAIAIKKGDVYFRATN